MARKRKPDRSTWPPGTDALLEETLVDAYGDDEQLWAIRQAIEDSVEFPADAHVTGEPATVLEIEYDGNTRRGLTAVCERDDDEFEISAADVIFPDDSEGTRYVAVYRKWLGLKPLPTANARATGRRRRPKAADEDIDLDKPVELVALAIKQSAIRCRLAGTERVITLRTGEGWGIVPGEILAVQPRKQWRFAGHPYLSGSIENHRIDAAALGLVPLRLEDLGLWNPAEEYWGEEDEPLDDWAKPIVARGPRPEFEMEQVLPGADPDDWDSDPILEASELLAGGDLEGGLKILADLLVADLRCLDAHAHLGNDLFEDRPQTAIRHYEMGVRIGELSLGEGFEGVLSWGALDNRPFLRCLHGYGLCLWRLDRLPEAVSVFERMLWLNPSDNQGVRLILPEVRAGQRWDERREQ